MSDHFPGLDRDGQTWIIRPDRLARHPLTLDDNLRPDRNPKYPVSILYGLGRTSKQIHILIRAGDITPIVVPITYQRRPHDSVRTQAIRVVRLRSLVALFQANVRSLRGRNAWTAAHITNLAEITRLLFLNGSYTPKMQTRQILVDAYFGRIRPEQKG